MKKKKRSRLFFACILFFLGCASPNEPEPESPKVEVSDFIMWAGKPVPAYIIYISQMTLTNVGNIPVYNIEHGVNVVDYGTDNVIWSIKFTPIDELTLSQQVVSEKEFTIGSHIEHYEYKPFVSWEE